MEAIIVNIIVVGIFALFAVLAIGPLMIEIQNEERKQGGDIVHLPIRAPHGPAGEQHAA